MNAELTTLIGELSAAKQARKEVERVLVDVKARENELAKQVQTILEGSGLKSASDGHNPVQLQTITQPKANDWPLIYDYIARESAFELLHKRLSSTAIKERWENGIIIPGVEAVSFNKLKY